MFPAVLDGIVGRRPEPRPGPERLAAPDRFGVGRLPPNEKSDSSFLPGRLGEWEHPHREPCVDSPEQAAPHTRPRPTRRRRLLCSDPRPRQKLLPATGTKLFQWLAPSACHEIRSASTKDPPFQGPDP